MSRRLFAHRLLKTFSYGALLVVGAPLAEAAAAYYKGPMISTPASKTPEQKAQERIERFVQTAWSAGLGLGFPVSTVAQIENRIRSLGKWATERRLPMPTGFSVSADVDAGIMIGAKAGAELVFLIPEEGPVEMGLFSGLDAKFGADAMLGAGIGVSFIFNMEKLEEIAGPIIGVNTEIEMLEGAGATLMIDVEKEEIAKLKESLRALSLAGDREALADLRAILTQKRVVAVGAQLEFGVGVDVSAMVGWRKQLGAVVLPSDAEEARLRLAQFKMKLRERFSRKKRHARNKIETPANAQSASDPYPAELM